MIYTIGTRLPRPVWGDLYRIRKGVFEGDKNALSSLVDLAASSCMEVPNQELEKALVTLVQASLRCADVRFCLLSLEAIDTGMITGSQELVLDIETKIDELCTLKSGTGLDVPQKAEMLFAHFVLAYRRDSNFAGWETLQEAASLGSPEAKFALADGVETDEFKRLSLLKGAAEAGHRLANLALIEKGSQYPRNDVWNAVARQAAERLVEYGEPVGFIDIGLMDEASKYFAILALDRGREDEVLFHLEHPANRLLSAEELQRFENDFKAISDHGPAYRESRQRLFQQVALHVITEVATHLSI